MPLFRNQLAFAVLHLLTHLYLIPHSPLTPLPLIQSTLRLAYERLGGGDPSSNHTQVTWPDGVPPVRGSLLQEAVESGSVRSMVGLIGMGTGRDTWKRVIGA